MNARPKWVLQGKNFGARFFLGKYLCFWIGDFTSPHFCKGQSHG